ncbi:MAG: hypothetical protein JNG84_09980, partial [Archangium sp.]|nr:hypothetical protein [Archangium sp.]
MTIIGLRKQEKRITSDNKIDRSEAKSLIEKGKVSGAISKRELREIKAIYDRNLSKMDEGARYEFESLLGLSPKPARPVGLGVIGVVKGVEGAKFDDDTVFLGRDGSVHGSTEVPAYTRGYVATKTGPLRKQNGSTAPASSVLTAAEQEKLKATTPG